VDSRFRHYASCSGIARKHGIVPKPFLEISQEREFVASQFGDYKKMFLIVQTYLEGQSLCSPHLTPQIQCLPEQRAKTRIT
jgi:hypothetical protein